MRVGSLFSGVGGIELGFEMEGFETVWFVEKDEYAKAILRKQWPNAIIYDDVTTIDWSTVPKVDVLTGGFPCQDISNAGKRVGITGSRSSLWRYYAEAIRILQPKYALIENVSALTSRGLNIVLSDIAKIGYDAEWIIYQLPPLVRCTAVKGYSSWPTPTALVREQTKEQFLHRMKKLGGSYRGIYLADAVKYKPPTMFPTPRATDHTGGYCQTEKLPTGQYREYRISSNQYFVAKLQNAIRFEEQKPTGQLNPTWVEWLMGFPIGWTELSVWETQSFHNVRKSLRKQLKKRS